MDDFSYCPKCKFDAEPVKQCPRCGRRIQKASTVRKLGWLLVVIGTFLVLFMGGITIVVAGMISQAAKPGSTGGFTGTPEQAALIFGIFGLVIAIGLTSVAGGIWQIKYGKRNKLIVVFTFVLAALFIIGGRIVTTALK